MSRILWNFQLLNFKIRLIYSCDYDITVSKEADYLKLFDHKVTATLVDSKLQVANRARHESAKAFKSKIFMNNWSDIDYAQLGWFDNDQQLINDHKKQLHNLAQQYSSARAPSRSKSQAKTSKSDKLIIGMRKAIVEEAAASNISISKSSKGPNATTSMDFGLFFSNKLNHFERCENCNGNVFDFYCSAQLSEPLLHQKAEMEFNPMIISLKSIGPMPDTPVPISEIRKKCRPLQIEFELFGKTYSTRPIAMERFIRVNSDFIILLGRESLENIRDTFESSLVKIKIRDREQIEATDAPALYGDCEYDNIWMTTDNLKIINDRKNAKFSHGIAKLNLSEIYSMGTKYFSLNLPVLPVDMGFTSGDIGFRAGHYLQNKTELHLKIKIR